MTKLCSSSFYLRSLALCLFALLPFIASAWDSQGHMTTGAICYKTLSAEAPATKTKVVAILEAFVPNSREGKWAEKLQGLTGEDREIALFELAARWPDDMKSDRAFMKATGSWHYYNKAISRDGVKGPTPKTPNVMVAYPLELDAMVHSKGDAQAEAICWVFHLTGDLHQPLHVTNLYSNEFPKGDAGGNDFIVRATDKAKSPQRLHSIWDGLGDSGKADFRDSTRRALVLLKKYPEASLPELKTNSDAKNWLDESYELAVTFVYQKGTLQGAHDLRGEGRGPNVGDQVVPALPEGYTAEAKAIAEKRIALAGYRMAKETEAVLR